jgi:hypothetical protein
VNLVRVAHTARGWLEMTSHSKRDEPLCRLGLWLCEAIRKPAAVELPSLHAGSVELPYATRLLEMTRPQLLALAQSIALSKSWTCSDRRPDREGWARVLGGIAVSYARTGDVAIVAALVRAGARMRVQGTWLTVAQTYLIDQQLPDGSFGLVLPELVVLRHTAAQASVALRLTAEVLWALAEVAAQEASVRGNSRRPGSFSRGCLIAKS